MEISRNFRAEFISSITSAPIEFPYEQNVKPRINLRAKLARIKILRIIYILVRRSFSKKRGVGFSSPVQIQPVNSQLKVTNFETNSVTKIFVVVPYFLEMNGPSSHYGDLLEICKTLDLQVYYVATEKNFLEDKDSSSYSEFKGVGLVDPSDREILLSRNSIIINCGSPWVYKNIDVIKTNGSLIIDYLFNHVGHTQNNFLNREKIFHTVCQHQKLLHVLQESTSDDSHYSCIPIPFPINVNLDYGGDKTSDSPLWVGRLSPEKGVDRLVDIALEFFRRSGNSVRVIGGGPLAKDLKRGIRNGSINYLGELSHGQTLQEIARSKVIINSSYVEGVSLVAMESLASEAFVISFDIGGMSELMWHPLMRIHNGGIQEFVDLMLSVERSELPNVENIPKEFTSASHIESWKSLLSFSLKCLN